MEAMSPGLVCAPSWEAVAARQAPVLRKVRRFMGSTDRTQGRAIHPAAAKVAFAREVLPGPVRAGINSA